MRSRKVPEMRKPEIRAEKPKQADSDGIIAELSALAKHSTLKPGSHAIRTAMKLELSARIIDSFDLPPESRAEAKKLCAKRMRIDDNIGLIETFGKISVTDTAIILGDFLEQLKTHKKFLLTKASESDLTAIKSGVEKELEIAKTAVMLSEKTGVSIVSKAAPDGHRHTLLMTARDVNGLIVKQLLGEKFDAYNSIFAEVKQRWLDRNFLINTQDLVGQFEKKLHGKKS